MRRSTWNAVGRLCGAAAGLLILCGGCPGVRDLLEDLEIVIISEVDAIQVVDPRFDPLDPDLEAALLDRGDTIFISEGADVVIDISQELVVEELPDILLLGLENLTGFDIYLEYFADDVLQGVLIFDGETLFIEYPCLESVDLIFEDDFDVVTGELVGSFDLDALFLNGEDFFCGDALIITLFFDTIEFVSFPLVE